ncbi:MAG: UDP-N-acetylglucosamine 2-epimerase (non-hydrolyzing) [Methanomassiliicoccales archaeon]|nr:UDP-N-acetylglucosamine 2-epimerase (non-hydrolyzing) [Methanomassiliicoccales archaeon]
MRFSLVLGTRPEIVKMAPVVRQLQLCGEDFELVHTGQHYSYDMDQVFFQDLRLPRPTVNLEVGSGPHGAQTGRMLVGLEAHFLRSRPDMVLVQGDTNTVLAGALAAAKMNIPVGHVEAGLRSFDRRMPEEINRVLVDHISDLLFTPTETSAQNLEREGVTKGVHVTGNTIVDAVRQNLRLAEERDDVLRGLGLSSGGYVLTTMHRQENVDSPSRMANVLRALGQVAGETGLDVVWPVHPRTRKNLDNFQLKVPQRVRVIEPLGFLQFLQLEARAALALTDSGGLQEECCILGVPCVTLRDSTERPETVRVGANVVVGTEPERVLEGVRRMLGSQRDWACPLGQEGAGARIVTICREFRKTEA